MKDRLLTTYKLLRDYINEMESHMLPVNENAMMRVDRNDIYWNIMEMETIMETLSDMSLDIHESPVDYIKDHAGLAAEQLGIVIAGEQEERKKRERNYQKILNYNQKVRSTVMPVIQEHLNDILSIYQDSIVPFENTDDTYRVMADNLYSEWATPKEKVSYAWDITKDVGRGAFEATKDFGKGMLNLAEVIAFADNPLVMEILPESMKEDIQTTEAGLTALLTDPVNTLEMMGQEMTDAYETEGTAYSVSYVATSLFLQVATTKGVGELAGGGEVLETTAVSAEAAGEATLETAAISAEAAGEATIETAAISAEAAGEATLETVVISAEAAGEAIETTAISAEAVGEATAQTLKTVGKTAAGTTAKEVAAETVETVGKTSAVEVVESVGSKTAVKSGVGLVDDVVESSSKSKWWYEGYVDNLSDTQMLLGVKQSDKGLSTLGSATKENVMSAGKAWVGDNYNIIKDNAGNVLGYSSADGMRAFRIQYKSKEGVWRANLQENIMVNNPYPNPGQHSSQLKNVHIDMLN